MYNYILKIEDNKIKSNDIKHLCEIIKNYIDNYKLVLIDKEINYIIVLNDYNDFMELLNFYKL